MQPVKVTRDDGRIPVKDAARLCGVTERAVRNWITRGYYLRDGTGPVYLPAVKEGREWYVLPVDLQKAEYHTAKRARRVIMPAVAPDDPELDLSGPIDLSGLPPDLAVLAELAGLTEETAPGEDPSLAAAA